MAVKLLDGGAGSGPIYSVQGGTTSSTDSYIGGCPMPADMAVLLIAWNSTGTRMNSGQDPPYWKNPANTTGQQAFTAAQGGYNLQLAAATEVSCEAWYLASPSFSPFFRVRLLNTNGYTVRWWLIFLKSDLSMDPVAVTYQGKVTGTVVNNPSLNITPSNNGAFACDVMACSGNSVESARTQALLIAAYDEGFWDDSASYLEQATIAQITFGHTVTGNCAQIVLAFNDGSAPAASKIWLPQRQLALDSGASNNDHVVWDSANEKWIDDVGYIDYVTSYVASYSTASASWTEIATQIAIPSHWAGKDVLQILSAQYIGKEDEYPGLGGTVGAGGIGTSIDGSAPDEFFEWAQTQYANTLHITKYRFSISGTYFRGWVRANSGTPRFTGITMTCLLIGPGT